MAVVKGRLKSAAYSSIADWFALYSNELTWIALVELPPSDRTGGGLVRPEELAR
jgi:hypothetical protein